MSKSEKVTESMEKSAKTCFNMWQRWVEKKKEGTTVEEYVKACHAGYPYGSKLKPSLLRSRVRLIKLYGTIYGGKIDQDDIGRANDFIDSISTRRTKKKAPEVEPQGFTKVVQLKKRGGKKNG